MELTLCQEIKEKKNIITHLSKKLDAATLSIAELMEENRLLKMKLYECNRKFRIYDAFLSGGGNTLKNDADDSSMKDDIDFKNNYHKDKNEVSHLRNIISYSNDYDDVDDWLILAASPDVLNDDVLNDDVLNDDVLNDDVVCI